MTAPQPRRTAIFGGLLIVAAILVAVFVVLGDLATWLTVVLLVLAGIAVLAGALMTLRDYEPPRRR